VATEKEVRLLEKALNEWVAERVAQGETYSEGTMPTVGELRNALDEATRAVEWRSKASQKGGEATRLRYAEEHVKWITYAKYCRALGYETREIATGTANRFKKDDAVVRRVLKKNGII
jgi:phosphosulfolactate synthase (CoM biosynthesis protein A)